MQNKFESTDTDEPADLKGRLLMDAAKRRRATAFPFRTDGAPSSPNALREFGVPVPEGDRENSPAFQR